MYRKQLNNLLNGSPSSSHKLTSQNIYSKNTICPTHLLNSISRNNKMEGITYVTGVQEKDKMEQSSVHHQSPENETDGIYQAENQVIVVPATIISTADGFEKKEQSWFAMSQIPTDLSIQVQDITFYVHKYPLISKCSYFSRVELQPPKKSNLSVDLKLDNFPGGSETFEIILKFCYGLPISLTVNNVAALRCASEFLEMTEALEDGNLISKSEAFFTFVVLSSWRDSITVLKSCETLSPWAENIQIVRRCCDSISWKISREASSTLEETINEEKWWFDDIAILRIDYFTRIITALKAKGMNPEIIGSCIVQYGEKWLPNTESEKDEMGRKKNELQWNIVSGRKYEEDIGTTKEQRMIVESLASLLPPQKEAVPCKFLLKMLKMATFCSASPALVSELEKRVGLVLESADVKDLLIPSRVAVDQGKLVNFETQKGQLSLPETPKVYYFHILQLCLLKQKQNQKFLHTLLNYGQFHSHPCLIESGRSSSAEEHSIHNVDAVQRILEYFLLYENQLQQQQQPGPLAISKLMDNYLAEIARDPKLPVDKFQFLAQSLPENARTCDDGLYRAIDTYLKTHPLLSEHERRKLCKVMNCGKLSLDACAHAAQNDRLPLRTIIQVLFSEQVKLRGAMIQKSQTEPTDISDQASTTWSTSKEIKSLKSELEKVKTEMTKLQRDYGELQEEHQKQNNKQRNSSSRWSISWRKIRKSALFSLKVDGDEDTDESRNKPNSRRRNSYRRRQSVS